MPILGIDWKALADRAKRALRWALLCFLGFGGGAAATAGGDDCCAAELPAATTQQK